MTALTALIVYVVGILVGGGIGALVGYNQGQQDARRYPRRNITGA